MKTWIAAGLLAFLTACNTIGGKVSTTDENAPLILASDAAKADRDRFKAQVQVENDMGFRAYVRFHEGPEFRNAEPATLIRRFPASDHAVLFVADDLTFQHPDRPVLAIDPEGRAVAFRVRLRDLWVIENNVSTGNVLFEEYAEDQVEDGWFVGFDEG